MKLKEFLKEYYGSSKEINMKSSVIEQSLELVLPGAFKSVVDYRKLISWNLDRDIYYREASKSDNNSEELYVTLTTGKMDYYITFDSENDFEVFLEKGLKKHKSYRKEYVTRNSGQIFLYTSRKYE